MGKMSCEYADADRGHTARGRERGQGNFELAANSDYDSRGSADPRESLRRRRISKLALSAHKVLPDQEARSLPLFFAWGRLWLRAEGVGWYGKMDVTGVVQEKNMCVISGVVFGDKGW